MSQNRYQFPGEKNCCQRSTKDQQTDETNEDNQEKDEERFTKTGTNHHESPRELERQSEAQRMLAPQSEANVCRHKCNRKKISPVECTGYPTEIRDCVLVPWTQEQNTLANK